MDINKTEGSRKTGTATSGGKTYSVYEPKKKPAAKGEMPEVTPKGILDRQKWERFMFQKHGNPYVERKQIDREVDRLTSSNEEALFGHVFGNQYRFEDRGRLDPKAAAVYRDALLKLRRNISDSITKDVTDKQARHKERMGMFDKYYGKDKPKEDKGPTGVDYKRLFDMIGKGSEDQAQLEIIKDYATQLGYDFSTEEPEGSEGWWQSLKNWVKEKVGSEDTTKRKEGESINEYLKRVGE